MALLYIPIIWNKKYNLVNKNFQFHNGLNFSFKEIEENNDFPPMRRGHLPFIGLNNALAPRVNSMVERNVQNHY